MRISDWSSGVCSSDLSGRGGASGPLYAGLQVFGLDQWAGGAGTFVLVAGFCPDRSGSAVAALPVGRLPGGAGVGGTGAIVVFSGAKQLAASIGHRPDAPQSLGAAVLYSGGI